MLKCRFSSQKLCCFSDELHQVKIDRLNFESLVDYGCFDIFGGLWIMNLLICFESLVDHGKTKPRTFDVEQKSSNLLKDPIKKSTIKSKMRKNFNDLT